MSILILREHGDQEFRLICEQDLKCWLPNLKYHETKSERNDFEARLLAENNQYISNRFNHIIINDTNKINNDNDNDNSNNNDIKLYLTEYGLVDYKQFLNILHTDYQNEYNLDFEIMQVFDID